MALVQICLCHVNVASDLPGLPQFPAPATDQSCAATSSANTLIGVGCPHPLPSRANLHSARGATACHFPRVPSMQAFGRRPRCKPHRCDRPASETLNKTGSLKPYFWGRLRNLCGPHTRGSGSLNQPNAQPQCRPRRLRSSRADCWSVELGQVRDEAPSRCGTSRPSLGPAKPTV